MSCLVAILMAVGCTSSPPTGPQDNAFDDTPTHVTNPEQVTDLVVTDSTATRVTLSFTQVDDGTGHPADYAVRTHVGPMDWGTAEEVTSGTCAAPLQGTAIGSRMTCTIEGLTSGVAYTFQVASFRGTFQAGAVYGNLSNVVPEMESSHPNEPVGLSAIASVDFSDGMNAQVGICNEHSDSWKQSNSDYLADTATPSGTGSVFRGRFPSGMDDGISPWRFDCWGPGLDAGGASHQYEELYVSFWMKVDGADYQNQTVGTKIFYVSYGTLDRYNDSYFMLDGSGTQSVQTTMLLRARLSTQDENGDTPALPISPNLDGSKKVRAGEWTRVEVRMKINDIGRNNGEFDLWVNGAHTTSVRDWRYRSSISPHAFYHLQFTPVYGGHSGDVRTRDDYWRIDNLYISGR